MEDQELGEKFLFDLDWNGLDKIVRLVDKAEWSEALVDVQGNAPQIPAIHYGHDRPNAGDDV